jgi:hypothetical protein
MWSLPAIPNRQTMSFDFAVQLDRVLQPVRVPHRPAPTVCAAADVSANQATITWTDEHQGLSAIRIERQLNGVVG